MAGLRLGAVEYRGRDAESFLVMGAVCLAAAGLSEEIFEDGDAVIAENAGTDLATMIEVVGLEEIPEAAGGTAFDIWATEDDAADAGVDDGSCAHGAGFFGDVEIAVGEAPVAEDALGLGEGEHFGVGGGIFEGFDLVPGTGDDLAVVDDDGADGDFVLGGGATGLSERFTHEVVVAVKIDKGGGVVHEWSVRKQGKGVMPGDRGMTRHAAVASVRTWRGSRARHPRPLTLVL